MKERPWIWIILANVIIVTGLTTLVVIAVKNQQHEVPVLHGH